MYGSGNRITQAQCQYIESLCGQLGLPKDYYNFSLMTIGNGKSAINNLKLKLESKRGKQY